MTQTLLLGLSSATSCCGWRSPGGHPAARAVHLGFAALFMALVMGFRLLDDPSMIGLILKIAAYTYGPLLGLFAFGVFTQRAVADRWVPAVALAGSSTPTSSACLAAGSWGWNCWCSTAR